VDDAREGFDSYKSKARAPVSSWWRQPRSVASLVAAAVAAGVAVAAAPVAAAVAASVVASTAAEKRRQAVRLCRRQWTATWAYPPPPS
jgi:hypothetical protein